MKAYKGFDKDLKCRGFQYEVGKEYEENEAKLCDKGFHACEFPFDVFGYYDPASSRYCEVDMEDVCGERSEDSKLCAKKIKIGAEIGLSGLIKAGVQMIVEKSEHTKKQTGNQSAATNTGDWSAATVAGKQSVAVSLGIEGKAKGALGCWIVLAEWKETDTGWERVDVQSELVDGDEIKEDTFYMLKNGQFEEVD